MCIATGLLCLLENTHVAPEGSTLDLEDEGSYPYLSHLFLFLIKHSVCSPHWKFLTPSPKLLSDLPASSLPDLPRPTSPQSGVHCQADLPLAADNSFIISGSPPTLVSTSPSSLPPPASARPQPHIMATQKPW